MSLLIASFSDTKEIAKKTAKALHANYAQIDAGKFPDSEFHLQLKKDPHNKTVIILSSISGDPNSKLVETILAAGIAKDYHAKKIILLATYLPYMRQDKHFMTYDSFSSKHILEMLSDFDEILVLDPHLHRLHNMREISSKSRSISANKLIADYIKKRFNDKFTIVGPDEESAQWSEKIAKMLKKKVVILKKTRLSSEHVKIKEKKLGGNVILIDDIISTGRTAVEALNMAKKQGAKKLICIGIHGVLAKGADKIITKYAELITTNSIPNRYAKIDISPVLIQELKKYS
jgi:ribose-phosphate pyrophosphokinase